VQTNSPRSTVVQVKKLVDFNGGSIRLDIGCGANVQPGFVGMDIQKLPGVGVVWDFNIHPWPIPEASCIQAMASHVVEHIPPVMVDRVTGTWFPFVSFMDAVWTVLHIGAQFMIACPYATSPGFFQDPTHCNPCNENTWLYFDPIENRSNGLLYSFYRPKPWQLEHISYDPAGNMEVIMRKRRMDKSYLGGEK